MGGDGAEDRTGRGARRGEGPLRDCNGHLANKGQRARTGDRV